MTRPADPPGRPCGVVLVGLGSLDRGDDAIGQMVAERVRDVVVGRALAGVRVVVHEDPTALMDLLADADVAVIVDAVRSGAPAGTVMLREAGRSEPDLDARSAPGPAGTHGFGLAAALALARALDRLPERVVVVGVEAADFERGGHPSAAVMNAVPTAVRAILDILLGGTTAADAAVEPCLGPSTLEPGGGAGVAWNRTRLRGSGRG